MDELTIPIHRRNGDIVAHVRVDAADAVRLSSFRWFLAVGYAARYDGRAVFLHREVMGPAPFERAEVDHINRDRLDCRRSNMRWVTHAQNMQNRSAHKGSRSGIRGVRWDGRLRCWRAEVKRDGRKVFRQRFSDMNLAAIAAAEARRVFLPFSTN